MRSNTHNRWTNRPRAAGFTLIEVVAVLAIMAIVLAIAQPRLYGFLQRDRIRRAAHRVAMDLRATQSEAIKQRTQTAVTYLPDSDAYTMWCGDPSDGSWSIMQRQSARANSTRVYLSSDPDYRVGIASADFGGATDVVFDEYGVPSAGGSIVVGIQMLCITVTVDPVTGRVTVGDLLEAPQVIEPAGAQPGDVVLTDPDGLAE